jgi:hypothetical protein
MSKRSRGDFNFFEFFLFHASKFRAKSPHSPFKNRAKFYAVNRWFPMTCGPEDPVSR